jgi:hypothetical protein
MVDEPGIGVVAATPPGAIFAELRVVRRGANPAGWSTRARASPAPETRRCSQCLRSATARGAGLDLRRGRLELDFGVSGSSGWSSYDSGPGTGGSSAGEPGQRALRLSGRAVLLPAVRRHGAWKLAKRGHGHSRALEARRSQLRSRLAVPVPRASDSLRRAQSPARFDLGRRRGPPPGSGRCWDTDPERNDGGRVGVYSSGAAGSHWDDLAVVHVAPDGAPPAYGTTPPAAPVPPPPSVPSAPVPAPPAASDGYTSESALLHWWRPGWNMTTGHDFATIADRRVQDERKGLKASDFEARGSSNASRRSGRQDRGARRLHDLPSESQTWSIAAWVRPGSSRDLEVALRARPERKDVDGQREPDLALVDSGHFAVEVSDSQGRTQEISARALLLTDAGRHLVPRGRGETKTISLALYVNGVLVAATSRRPSLIPAPRATPRAGGLVGTGSGASGRAASPRWRSGTRRCARPR